MKTGIELFKDERNHQIEKYGFTGEHHANHPEWYDQGQLTEAARYLSDKFIHTNLYFPKNWDKDWFFKLCARDYKERLIIAGALFAAEIDRIQELEQ